MRKRNFGSRCSSNEGLSIYHDRDVEPPGRLAAERGVLVQEAREVDARSAGYLSQAGDKRVKESFAARVGRVWLMNRMQIIGIE